MICVEGQGCGDKVWEEESEMLRTWAATDEAVEKVQIRTISGKVGPHPPPSPTLRAGEGAARRAPLPRLRRPPLQVPQPWQGAFTIEVV